MRIKLAGVIATALLICACGAQIVRQPLYPQEQAYLDEAMAQPLQFDVPASESTAVPSRNVVRLRKSQPAFEVAILSSLADRHYRLVNGVQNVIPIVSRFHHLYCRV
jgi:hypothetical protein